MISENASSVMCTGIGTVFLSIFVFPLILVIISDGNSFNTAFKFKKILTQTNFWTELNSNFMVYKKKTHFLNQRSSKLKSNCFKQITKTELSIKIEILNLVVPTPTSRGRRHFTYDNKKSSVNEIQGCRLVGRVFSVLFVLRWSRLLSK